MVNRFLDSIANTLAFLKEASQTSIVINLITACVLLAVGLFLLFRKLGLLAKVW